MAADFTLGGVIIPGNSDFAFNYVGARWDRFNDWTHLGGSGGEWAALPQGERCIIIDRLRWLMRNNEYCAALHTTFQTHLGNSTLRSKARDNQRYNDAKELLWIEFSQACEVSGLSLGEVEDIIKTELLCAGEIFILKLKTGQIQLIPSEYVFSKSDDGEGWIQGIRYDGQGVPLLYRIGSRNSKGQLIAGEEPIPASQVWHIYRRERAEQLRGVPWLAVALKSIKDLDELVNAKVTAVKNQSFLSFAVKSDGGSVLPNFSETGNTNGATKTTGKPSKNIVLRNGTVVYLEKGDEIEALSTQYQSQDFESFLLSRLRAVGATIGLPLELFLEGYRDSNYSSARATNLAWARKVTSIRRLIELKFLAPLQIWTSERARAANKIKGTRELDKECSFSWPPIPSIDALKEAEANIKLLGAGLTTYSAVYAENNLFFDDEIKVRARDARLMIEAAKAENIPPQMLAPDLKLAEPAAPSTQTGTPTAPAPDQNPDNNAPSKRPHNCS